jgi:hypothetical protein
MKTSAGSGAPLSTKAIGVLVLLGILGLLVFAMTKARWYDHLEPKEKVAFWTDTGVAAGTLALAVVTWVSVVATQDIVKNEDLRFRQSRMPLVKILESNYGDGLYRITLLNIGDGPAKDVTGDITATFTVRTMMQDKSSVDHVRHYEEKHMFMVSYLPATKSCQVALQIVSESGEAHSGVRFAEKKIIAAFFMR